MGYKFYCNGTIIYDPGLPDSDLHVLDPILNQEVNSHGSLSFTIQPSHPSYDNIKKLTSIITVYCDTELVFRGRVIETTRDFYNNISVYAEGELAFLCDSIHRPFTHSGSASDLFRWIIENHNQYVETEKKFAVGQFTLRDPKVYSFTLSETMNTWDLLFDAFVNQLGGYIATRHEDDVTYIDYLADFPESSAQEVKYGENILGITDSVTGGEIITVLLPYGAKLENSDSRLTVSSVNGGVDYIKAEDSTLTMYKRVWGTETWDDITDPSVLLATAQSYLAERSSESNTLVVDALDLSAVDPSLPSIQVGQYVKVVSVPHGINKRMLCTAKTTDILYPENTTVTLGPTTKTLTAAVSKSDTAIQAGIKGINNASSVANKALTAATTAENSANSAYDMASRAVTTLLGGKKIACGWSDVSFISTKDLNTTISFGATFSAKPVVLISQPFNSVVCTAFESNVTTTSFIVNVPKVGSTTQSTRKMAWLAIGDV